MSGQFSVSINADQIKRKLDDLTLTYRETKKVTQQAIRKSLSIVRASVRRGAAKVTSDAEKRKKLVALSVYDRIYGGKVDITRVEYLTQDKNHRGRGVFGLFWLERGTNRGIGRDGRLHGKTPAKPFFEAAVRRSMPKAQQRLNQNILNYIEKVAAKRAA